MRNLCEVWFSRESGNINHLTQWFWTAHLARGQGSSSLPPEIPLWKGPGVDSPAPGNQPRHANQDILLHLNFFAPQTMSAASATIIIASSHFRMYGQNLIKNKNAMYPTSWSPLELCTFQCHIFRSFKLFLLTTTAKSTKIISLLTWQSLVSSA